MVHAGDGSAEAQLSHSTMREGLWLSSNVLGAKPVVYLVGTGYHKLEFWDDKALSTSAVARACTNPKGEHGVLLRYTRLKTHESYFSMFDL